jgi:hypothetical protein
VLIILLSTLIRIFEPVLAMTEAIIPQQMPMTVDLGG